MSGGARRGRRQPSRRRYDRTRRVNHVLQEVVATELGRLDREELGLLTVTGVEADPEFHRAVVYVDHLDDEQAEILAELRVRLQRAVGDQVRLKRTPELVFLPDPAIAAGERVDEILRDLQTGDEEEE